MTTATPTSVKLPEKKRLWKEYKYDKFQQISQDKALMFNYFVENNDLFGMISKEDMLRCFLITQRVKNSGKIAYWSSLGGIFFIDQILMRFALPSFKIPHFRFTVFFIKYGILPVVAYGINREYFLNEEQIQLYRIQERYGFGFDHFMSANRIFQRALEVNRLEELLQKRTDFDWSGIPELPPDYKI